MKLFEPRRPTAAEKAETLDGLPLCKIKTERKTFDTETGKVTQDITTWKDANGTVTGIMVMSYTYSGNVAEIETKFYERR